MQHPPITLVCAPQCQTSCPAVCPPSCCNALSQQYHGIYSSSALPLQPVYTNHCPSPCPSSCAPKCSPKCCNAIIYRSQLYLKRKVIGRKSFKKRSKLRKLGKLHQLKKAIKLSQNWGPGVSKINHFLTFYDIFTSTRRKTPMPCNEFGLEAIVCTEDTVWLRMHRFNGKREQNCDNSWMIWHTAKEVVFCLWTRWYHWRLNCWITWLKKKTEQLSFQTFWLL